MPSLFGENKTRKDLQNAVQQTIERWLEDYLAEYERRHKLDPQTIPVFKEYSQVNEFRNWADDETPVCVIVSPGLHEPPAMKGDGHYDGKFDLGVACIVQANVREKTNDLASIYGPIIRQLLLQQRGLGGFSSGLTYEDEKYDDVPESEDRAQAVAQVIFTVDVPGIVNYKKGIIDPSDDPYGIDAEEHAAESASVTIEKVEEVGP